jgi:hypothetical protein
MSDWSDEETNDPLVADVCNFYKVEKWTKDSAKVDTSAWSNVGKLRAIRLALPQSFGLPFMPKTGQPLVGEPSRAVKYRGCFPLGVDTSANASQAQHAE